MNSISLDFNGLEGFISANEWDYIQNSVESAAKLLKNRKGPGSEFLGWRDLPIRYDKIEFARVEEAAQRIRSNSKVLVVIGIGGSYLGAKSGLEFLGHSFQNRIANDFKNGVEVHFAGHNISSEYLTDLIEVIGHRDFAINVISKSGTTTEPAIAFRVLRKLLIQKYGKEGAKDRIIATTDKSKGALKKLSDAEGYETFAIPDDVGGRYSVLSPVGLLPLAIAGYDIKKIMIGANNALKESRQDFESNDCYKYVAARNILLRKGFSIELLVNYNPKLHFFAEWWKQLFGESEGKDQKGLFPAAVDFSTDLHSMGQYIQDGQRILFETTLNVQNSNLTLFMEEEESNLDNLNYLSGKTLDDVNYSAMQGTIEAHRSGGVPNIVINIPQKTESTLGYLFYFFQKSCAISGYVLGVNPFDQPGVEAYKTNMFRLLGKEGFA